VDKENLEQLLATAHAMLQADAQHDAAKIVRKYSAQAEQTGFDNWNGGVEFWDVYFALPVSEFSRLGTLRSVLEENISEKFRMVLEHDTQHSYSAKLVPAKVTSQDWRVQEFSLPRQARINILDGLRLESVDWSGRLDDVDFLSRLYDLQTLPSGDSRFQDAAGDIWQHRINNDDWERDWVYDDERFQLINGPADSFLRFLCEVVHPVVRPEQDEAKNLVAQFNDQLGQWTWELFEEERIAGRPRYWYRRISQGADRFVSRGRTVADALDAGWMEMEIERLESAIERDPPLAIGTAKELVETCCKTILTRRNIPFTKSEDIGELTKKLTKELRLVPEGITDETKGADNIRLILRNLTQLTNNLAQLRGLYGTGHGRDGQHRGLQPRHARLAVASAIAFVDFVVATYHRPESS
jgi:hypothetical protein